jgi:hypothetical protein
LEKQGVNMNRIYQRFAVAVASTTIVAIIGSISKAEAFQLFSDRAEWEAALNAPTKTLDFGEPTVFSGTKVFPNGVSVSANVVNGQASVEGTRVGAVYNTTNPAPGTGSVRGDVIVKLPSGVTALGFEALNNVRVSNFLSEAGQVLSPSPTVFSLDFLGIISEAGDPLLTGLSIGSNSPGTGFFNARNISYKSVSVPEGSSTLGILAAFGAFGVGTAFLRRQKQYKSTTAVH